MAQGISRLTGFGGTVSDITTSSTDDIDHPFSYSYTYTRKNYGDWENHRIIPALPPFGMPSAKENEEKSPGPIYFNGPTDFIYTSKIELPKGYTPQLPKPVDLKFDFADYHSTYTFKDGVLIAERTLSLKTDELPATSRKDYLKLDQAVRDDENQFIALSQGQASNEAAVNRRAMKIFNQALQALQIRDVGGAQDLLTQALNLDPKFERAWILEGALHEMRGEFDEGYADLRKAIALNPKDPQPYRSLAAGLIRQGKREEAIQVLQNLLKLAPNDSRGQSLLGTLLLADKEYSKAVPQLQAALAADQGNPMLEVSLAQAYAGMGDGAKAADAFKKAAATDPTPRVWKTAADSLANFDQQLPEAQHYAELAVKADETRSAKLTIASAGADDLALMGSMASDRDALGWVYFKEKNLTAARKYLEAAWNLSQSETIGDHLGQVYEKLGNGQLAIKMYALAAESSPIGASDAHARLSRLLGDQVSKVEAAQMKASFDITQASRVELGKVSKTTGSAEFLVLFSPGPKVEGLKFTSGDQPLKAASDAIRSAQYHLLFPDTAPVRILRHGVLVCPGPSYGCDFTLTSSSLSSESPAP